VRLDENMSDIRRLNNVDDQENQAGQVIHEKNQSSIDIQNMSSDIFGESIQLATADSALGMLSDNKKTRKMDNESNGGENNKHQKNFNI